MMWAVVVGGEAMSVTVIPSADPHEPALTAVYEDARSALECGSEAERSYRLPLVKNKAVAGATALQGASRIFMAVAYARRLTSTQKP